MKKKTRKEETLRQSWTKGTPSSDVMTTRKPGSDFDWLIV